MINTPSNTDMCPTATHIPYLAALVGNTDGPVVEFGTGHYSTGMLHHICKPAGRRVVSVDTDQTWLDFFRQRFNNEHHDFYCTDNMLISKVFFREEAYQDIFWSVAFIDNSPPEDRRRCLEAIRNKAKFIVVHDSELEAQAYGWGSEEDNIFDTFKHVFHCPPFQ